MNTRNVLHVRVLLEDYGHTAKICICVIILVFESILALKNQLKGTMLRPFAQLLDQYFILTYNLLYQHITPHSSVC